MTGRISAVARRLLRVPEPLVVSDHLSAGANAILAHAARQRSVTTAEAARLLQRDRGVRRAPHKPSAAGARELCMQLVDDGWLSYGAGPDTWQPTTNTTQQTKELVR